MPDERTARRPPPIPLTLCYHKVEPRRELGVTRLSPARFARQVARLARDGWRTLTIAELEACATGRRAPGPRELAITFDDAYRGLREHAFPVLADHGWTAATAVITEYAGRLNRWDVAYGGRRFAHLAWRDVERWAARGFDFVSHTATHPRLTWLREGEAAGELAASRDALGVVLGALPRVISYPFGAAGARERRLAREAGYAMGLDLAERWTGDPMAVPRLPVYAWSPPRPGVGPLARLEWAGAVGANRCAVGTTIIQRLLRQG